MLTVNMTMAYVIGDREALLSFFSDPNGAIVRFDDTATLAAIRRAITMAESNAVDEPSCFRPIAVFAGRVVGPSVIGLA